MNKLVLIYSNEHKAWWKPNYCGYTNDITKAGIFEYEDALNNYPRMSYDENNKDYFIDVTQEMIRDRYDTIASEIDKLQEKLSYLTSLLNTINDCENTSESFDSSDKKNLKNKQFKIKDGLDPKVLYNFGFVYEGNWARGELYQKEIPELKGKGDGISINFDLGAKIDYIHPYMGIKYPNIENYIQDLIKAGYVEAFEQFSKMKITMKYVRTPNGIYEVKKDGKEFILDDSILIAVYDTKVHQVRALYKDDALKQADTIIELCDRFVYDEEVYYPKIVNGCLETYDDEGIEIKITEEMIKEGIYGAIWTDKGLIYVAKLNEREELELI